ncbi:rRNA maturation RNase YbeY [Roseicitreum antarcticum]|uniref:Endoribonuclease YbeY n=1 Tax=Roseicitreum antarcticum TaxID=564137 RepID=A0A1H2UG19_9RHOB|nr:probable rRNA maturation factor [Roseicitreum antarcticum]
MEDDRWSALDLEAMALNAAQAVLSHLGHSVVCVELSVLACDDARIAGLNGDFRGKPAPTNVLSWPTWDLSADADGDRPEAPEPGTVADAEPLGDIALAYDTCAREAVEQEKRFGDHVVHLLVHSVLHLLGYDHIRDKDAALMEELERQILATMGVSDPYEARDVILD